MLKNLKRRRGEGGGIEVTLQGYLKHEKTGSKTHESNRYIGQ